jgi:hypothetical protein
MDLNTLFDTNDIVPGPLKGVRFWSYALHGSYYHPPRAITSFQNDIEWVASRPAQSDMEPTFENLRGINVYKTEGDALRGSADAVNGVVEDVNGLWIERQCGLVIGEVEFEGPTVEWEFGYTAQFVKPTKFTRAWGYEPEQMVDDLNLLWFAGGIGLSYSERVMLAIQRGGIVTAADIDGQLRQTFNTLGCLEANGFVSHRRAHYDDGVMYRRQNEMAEEQGVCLSCHQWADEDCREYKPRLYQLTLAGQDALLAALRRK